MAKDIAAKEKAAIVEAEDKLRAKREQAGWTTTEWGEFVPPVTEVDDKKNPQPQSESVITANDVVIPSVAEPVVVEKPKRVQIEPDSSSPAEEDVSPTAPELPKKDKVSK